MLLLVNACETAYPLAATTCDDYCRAVQRADCDDDAPADCVRDCERERGTDDCDRPLASLGECYASSEAGSFFCEEDQSRVKAICLAERRVLDECRSPGSGACFDECVRQSEACQASLDDCERDCRHPTAGCEEASNRYNACLQDYPVECREWLQMETRSPDDVPCYYEGIALFVCGN